MAEGETVFELGGNDSGVTARLVLSGGDEVAGIRAARSRNGDVFFVTSDARVVAVLVRLSGSKPGG